MRSWSVKEAKQTLQWAVTPEKERSSIAEFAKELGRTPKAIVCFLQRQLPPGQRPWREKPRWCRNEVLAICASSQLPDCLGQRTKNAIRKYRQRNLPKHSEEKDQPELTVTGLAHDLGVSRSTVYRLLAKGYLRRWQGGVSEKSFRRLLEEHPEIIPYSRLSRDQREWLVLNGFPDNTIGVNPPSSALVLKD